MRTPTCFRQYSGDSLNSPATYEKAGLVPSFSISGNDVLTKIDGLSKIRSAGSNFDIAFNPLLEDLDSLTSLTYVGGELFIYDLDNITDIDGLRNLRQVDDLVNISEHASLTTINLSSLTSVAGNVRIIDNPVLPTCEADNYVTFLTGYGWAGTADTSGNDNGGTCP